MVRAAAATLEPLWRLLGREQAPPVTRLAVWLSPARVHDRHLQGPRGAGFEPVKTREQGLTELRELRNALAREQPVGEEGLGDTVVGLAHDQLEVPRERLQGTLHA